MAKHLRAPAKPKQRFVAIALVRSEGVQMTKALAGDLHAFRALRV